MTTGRNFESPEDVERYFASRSDLTPILIPPADLWERLDQENRKKQQKHSRSTRFPAPSVPQAVEINFYPPTGRRKLYALKLINRVRTPATAKSRTRKARYSHTAPISWKNPVLTEE